MAMGSSDEYEVSYIVFRRAATISIANKEPTTARKAMQDMSNTQIYSDVGNTDLTLRCEDIMACIEEGMWIEAAIMLDGLSRPIRPFTSRE